MSEPNAPTTPPPPPLELLDCLGRLENEFERKEEYWRNQPEDPHTITTAIMVAMGECKNAIRTVIAEVVARQNQC